MSIIEKAIGKFSNLDAPEKTTRIDKVKELPPRKINVEEAERPQETYIGHYKLEESYTHYMKQAGYLAPDDQLQRTVDEYRRIKHPLLANAFGKQKSLVENGRLMAITSSIPDEGKTFTAVNLALSLSRERNRSVLLIDADMIKADTSKTFELQERAGLMDMLLDEDMPINDVMVSTDFPNLSIIPAGQQTEQSVELLTSNRMQTLLENLLLEDENRIVLFDIPPVLARPEAHVVCSLVGQVIVVVEAVTTPRNLLGQALKNLDRNKAISLLLNKNHRSLGFDYSGDYFGYY